MINLGELLLLHRVGVSVPCRNGRPIGVINDRENTCICCGDMIPEGLQICLNCERREEK